MTISTEIARLKTSIANAYDALEAKGAIIPAIENPDNLVYAIDTISVGGGDEITATNTTGSTISADDRVWVEPVIGEVRDFTVVGSPTINDTTKTITNFSGSNYITVPAIDTQTANTWEIGFRFSYGGDEGVNQVYFCSTPMCLQIRAGSPQERITLYMSSNGTSWDIANNVTGSMILQTGQTYYIKLFFDGSKYILSYSTDGVNYITDITITSSVKINPNATHNIIGSNASSIYMRNGYFYLGDTYIKVNGNIVWTPYKEAVVGYSIINDTDITSTSFTGIAQEAIANNASGSIKTLLDGNGTYAPTTATKSITTNGTYTASAENAYGLSEVTVNVPTINNTTVNITPTRSFQTFTPESPYTGYSRVRVYGVTRSIDTNIQSNNIKEGVSILGVTGTLTPTPIKEWHNWKNFSWSSTTKRLSNTQWNGKAITYGDGNFVTVSNGSKAEYSMDGGVTWYETNMPSSADWSCIAYGDGVFVAIASTYSSQTGSNKAAYSTDGGVTWNSTTMPNTRRWRCVAYGGGKFIAVAYNSNKAAYSSDGITWAEIDIPQNNWVSIAYGNGTFVVIPNLSYNAAYSTDGGATWHTSRLSFDNPWRCVAYGNGVFVAVDSSSGSINYSTDGGVTWTKSNWSTWRYFYSVVYGDGKFIAISKYESYKYAVAISSTDGNTWTVISDYPNMSYMTSIAYGNGRFVCTGSTDTVEIGSQSECYTLEATPTTSSTVYSAPNTPSALTITSVGTSTITCSDTKVYSRNSADDEDSVMDITQNGTYDVTEYVSANVNVPSAPTKKYNLLDRVTDDSNNEIGTVSGFFTDANNVEYAVVCLDAQYRITTDPYGNGQIASSYITYGTGSEYVSNAYGLKATATENTTAILGVAASSPAATHCRSKTFTIGGNTYSGQLPNLVEITDIMAQKTTLNSLDTSKSSYSSYVLPNNDNNVWSSSPASSGYAWDVGVNQISSMTTNNSAFVAPVLELPNA